MALNSKDLQLIGTPHAITVVKDANISSFDIYVDRNIIYLIYVDKNKNPKFAEIYFQFSTDAGNNWSEPMEIGKQFGSSVESTAGNDIQIAATDEQILVVWQTTGEIPGMGPLAPIYSYDGGKNWQRGENPADSQIDQSHHDIVADKKGIFHIVWLDDREENGYQGLRYAKSKEGGQKWELQQTLDDSTCSCCWNRLLVTSDGNIDVLYRDMEPRDMAIAQSTDSGASWRQLGKVANFEWKFDGCPHNGGGLTEAGVGTIHSTVWTGKENKVGLYHSRSLDGGKTWQQPQVMGSGTNAFHSDIAAIDEKRVAVIWDAMGPDGSTINISKSTDEGNNWLKPRVISTPGVSASFPRVVATANGWLAVWYEQKPKESKKLYSAIIQ